MTSAGTKTERLLRAVPPRVCQYDVVAATSASQARALRLRPQAGWLRTLWAHCRHGLRIDL